MKVYTAGPMRGKPYWNYPLFHAASDLLREAGHEAVSPAEIDEKRGIEPPADGAPCADGDVADFLLRDLAEIAACDAIALLPGWPMSTGAKTERAFAEAAGKKIYRLDELTCEGPRGMAALADLHELEAMYASRYERSVYVAKEVVGPDEVVLKHNGEVRTTSSTGGEKGVKPERYDLIPVEALAEVARLYDYGATKYSDRNWEKGYEFSKSYASLQRHANAFWSGQDVDPESGRKHLASVVFHAFALMTWGDTHPEMDDRP